MKHANDKERAAFWDSFSKLSAGDKRKQMREIESEIAKATPKTRLVCKRVGGAFVTCIEESDK